jgi:hypothetical protein
MRIISRRQFRPLVAVKSLDHAATDLRHHERLVPVGDRDRNPWIALDVAGLARFRPGQERDALSFKVDPQGDAVRRTDSNAMTL